MKKIRKILSFPLISGRQGKVERKGEERRGKAQKKRELSQERGEASQEEGRAKERGGKREVG